jgi:hypothetical protein
VLIRSRPSWPQPLKKAAPAGHRTQKTSEEDNLREIVSEVTGVHFEVISPPPGFPLSLKDLQWFMRCRSPEEIIKSPHVNAAWREKDGPIWLESLAIGDTIDWIELAYGEERAAESLDLDYSYFDDPPFQAEFKQRFPIVLGRIKEYSEIVSKISSKRSVHLEIRHMGARGMLVFTLAARLSNTKRLSRQALTDIVSKNVAAMKETYGELLEIWEPLASIKLDNPDSIKPDNPEP